MLKTALRLAPALCRTLVARGINTVDEATRFLNADLSHLYDPFLMRDMDKAVVRLQDAITLGERVLIYGDYDADGICGTTLLFEGLERLGANASYYVPDRLAEGYGLNKQRVRWAHEFGTKLIVCVDNGIGSYDEIQLARELGVDVIVADHHEPSADVLPLATAVLDPKRHDQTYPFRELSGVGVALKLYQALTNETAGLDLVALGTVADVVPLLDENRILVRAGLDEINSRRRAGIAELIAVSGLGEGSLNTWNLAFQLAPRINAAGRLGTAHMGVQLLLTNSAQAASEMAKTLDSDNTARRAIEQEILQQADAILSRSFTASQRAIVLADRNWHPGVIGVAASRLVEHYYRPTALIALTGTTGKGSARSIQGFDIHAALESCSDLLESFGGHRLAAGFMIKEELIEQLRNRLNQLATERIPQEKLMPELKIDAVVRLDEITEALLAQLDKFKPFGAGNPPPVFACEGVEPVGTIDVFKDSHIKFRVRQNDVWRAVVGFDMADLQPLIKTRKRFDIAFTPQLNRWQDKEQTQLILEDVRVA